MPRYRRGAKKKAVKKVSVRTPRVIRTIAFKNYFMVLCTIKGENPVRFINRQYTTARESLQQDDTNRYLGTFANSGFYSTKADAEYSRRVYQQHLISYCRVPEKNISFKTITVKVEGIKHKYNYGYRHTYFSPKYGSKFRSFAFKKDATELKALALAWRKEQTSKRKKPVMLAVPDMTKRSVIRDKYEYAESVALLQPTRNILRQTDKVKRKKKPKSKK